MRARATTRWQSGPSPHLPFALYVLVVEFDMPASEEPCLPRQAASISHGSKWPIHFLGSLNCTLILRLGDRLGSK